jgi:Sulfotransferase family
MHLCSARSPLFIVGSPRSGTSILVDALLTAGYHGYREGAFLSLIVPLASVIERHYSIFAIGHPKLLISQISQETLQSQVYEMLKRLAERHLLAEPWLDKTGNPEMILAIPVLRRLWSESVFLFAKRRAIENVASRLKKFPAQQFQYHCDDWARNMRSWRQMRENIPEDRKFEIDQQEIAQFPEQTAVALAQFLRLDQDSAEVISSTFVRGRPQETSDGTAHRLLRLDQTGWSEDQIRLFRQSCGVEMEAYGYSEDANYWGNSGGSPIRHFPGSGCGAQIATVPLS